MPEAHTLTLNDLIRQINEAVVKMRKSNPHRRLLLHCGQVMIDLAKRIPPPTEGTASVYIESGERIQ